MRRKIATWSIERLKAYISETVFFQAMGCLLPIVYLTAESTQCLGPRNELEGHILEKCGGVLVPQLSVTIMLTFFMFVRLILTPLGTVKVTRYELASFNDISVKLKSQLFLFAIAGESKRESRGKSLNDACMCSTDT